MVVYSTNSVVRIVSLGISMVIGFSILFRMEEIERSVSLATGRCCTPIIVVFRSWSGWE